MDDLEDLVREYSAPRYARAHAYGRNIRENIIGDWLMIEPWLARSWDPEPDGMAWDEARVAAHLAWLGRV